MTQENKQCCKKENTVSKCTKCTFIWFNNFFNMDTVCPACGSELETYQKVSVKSSSIDAPKYFNSICEKLNHDTSPINDSNIEIDPHLGFNDYQRLCRETAIYPGKGTILGLYYTALGLGEAGEVQGKIKKIIRDHNGIATKEMIKKIMGELGDILWYISTCCDELSNASNGEAYISLKDIASENIEKLFSRKERGTLQGDGDER